MWMILAVALLAQQADYEAQGLQAMEDQQYAMAVEYLTKAAQADPSDYSVHFNLGLAHSLLEHDDLAIAEYRKTLELKPGLYEAQLNLGISLIRSGDAAGAIPVLESAAGSKPSEYRPHFYWAEALSRAQRFSDAERVYSETLKIKADSADAELGLGRAIAGQGRPKDAEPHYRRAAALDKTLQDSLLELAGGLETAGLPLEAADIYREFPADPAAQERLGALLLAGGQPADAIAPLEAAVAASPTPANRLALAQAYVKAKQPEKAEPHAAQAVAAAPADVPLRLFYARILRDQRKFTEASAQFLAVAQRKPDSVEAWTEYAGLAILLEEYPQALAALDKVRAMNAEIPGHYFIRAIVLDKLHILKEALENYNKFLASDQGKSPDEEFKARQRARILEREINKR